ncbi:hypothetical protein Tco_1123017 [Tanacetum coccineum]|uniref:Uncharacterized protein n=1 Tax=Tanacetum coccineum TaxID=301880 RepID=A0ABQ5J4Z8_9ASTR
MNKKDLIRLDKETALNLQAEFNERLARGYKLKDLKLKEFDSIQEMFDRAFKRKQKVEDDKETTKLKQLMKIIPDEDEVAIDAIPLAVKSPSIYACDEVNAASENMLEVTTASEYQVNAANDRLCTIGSHREWCNLAKNNNCGRCCEVMPITTAKEKAQRRVEAKARSTLMMGIPSEHQLTFNFIKDAKKLLEAVEKIFGGTAATRKT